MAAHEPGDVHTQFFDAFNARDVEALASLYEDGALLVMPGGGNIGGNRRHPKRRWRWALSAAAPSDTRAR